MSYYSQNKRFFRYLILDKFKMQTLWHNYYIIIMDNKRKFYLVLANTTHANYLLFHWFQTDNLCFFPFESYSCFDCLTITVLLQELDSDQSVSLLEISIYVKCNAFHLLYLTLGDVTPLSNKYRVKINGI